MLECFPSLDDTIYSLEYLVLGQRLGGSMIYCGLHWIGLLSTFSDLNYTDFRRKAIGMILLQIYIYSDNWLKDSTFPDYVYPSPCEE